MEVQSWLETVSGDKFDFDNIPDNKFTIQDIAHSLSLQCRYNGHTRGFYSVAEHSKMMANFGHYKMGLTNKECLTLLLHDAAECYIGDLVLPLKLRLPEFRDFEKEIDLQVAKVFGSFYPFPDFVKEFDSRILVDERKWVLNKSDNKWWVDNLEPLGLRPRLLIPRVAEEQFLHAYDFYRAWDEEDEISGPPELDPPMEEDSWAYTTK